MALSLTGWHWLWLALHWLSQMDNHIFESFTKLKSLNSSFIDRPRLLTTGKCVGGEEPFLCFDVDCYSGLEVNGEVVFENCDLRDQALDQRLVKLRDGGGLLPDEILKQESLQPT